MKFIKVMLHVYNDKISEEIQEANFLPVIVGEISNDQIHYRWL